MRISDWSSDVCSSDLLLRRHHREVDVDEGQIDEERFLLVVRLLDELRRPIDEHVGGIPLPGADLGRIGAHLFPVDEKVLGVLLHLRSEEHTSELQSLMRISYAVFCLKKKKKQ